MRRMPWATYLWPGLPHLWFSGLWSGLALAAGFAVLLNLLVLASFVWVELLSPLDLRLGWLAVGSLWGGSAAISAWFDRGATAQSGAASAEVLFREALSEYLQGSWFEAETILGRLLHLDPRDVEARLLLATLLRHTGRYQEALNQLNRLERLQDSHLWAREIAAEKQWISEGQSPPGSAIPNPLTDIPSEPESRQAA